MSWQAAEIQLRKIVGFFTNQNLKKETLIVIGGHQVSIASELKRLHNYERKYEYNLDSPSSGESSPCISDSERETRYVMPTVQEVSDLLTEDVAVDIDYAIDRLREFKNKDVTLLFENIDPNVKTNRFLGYFRDVKANGYYSEKILSLRDPRLIIFRGRYAFTVNITVKKPDCIVELLNKVQSSMYSSMRIQPRISYVVNDRRVSDRWHAVVVRNLPATVSQRELSEQCQRDVYGAIQVGTISKIKDKHCCIIRCDYLEDAELICKRLNNFQLKTPNYEKYTIKVFLLFNFLIFLRLIYIPATP